MFRVSVIEDKLVDRERLAFSIVNNRLVECVLPVGKLVVKDDILIYINEEGDRVKAIKINNNPDEIMEWIDNTQPKETEQERTERFRLEQENELRAASFEEAGDVYNECVEPNFDGFIS